MLCILLILNHRENRLVCTVLNMLETVLDIWIMKTDNVRELPGFF